jgi:tetratricopeptide (TPR) repeat protein
LQKGQYHIFHFIGHGGFDRQTEEGVLVMRDEAGRGRFVSGQQLGWLLHNHHTLSLAILNACEGARADKADAFAGTGQSLVQQGIPAVIAMQFEITDAAAKTFAYGFYSALALGQPVEAALTETRLTLFSEDHGLEWGTPVLYMRSTDGRVFNVQQQADAARRQARITELYQAAQAAMSAQDWAGASASWQAILAIDPGHVHATAGLEQVGKQQELASLYAAGRSHFEAGRWQEALNVLGRAQAIDPDYMDVSALAGDARLRLDEAQRKGQAQLNTPVQGIPGVDTRGTGQQTGPFQGTSQAPTAQAANPAWTPTAPTVQPYVQPVVQPQDAGGGRAPFVGAGTLPAPAPAPPPKRRMVWVIPALLVGLLVVFGTVAFAFLSSRQAEERAASATATTVAQVSNARSTSTARAEARATVRANTTATSLANDAIINANATSTAYAILIETDAQATIIARANATATALAANIDPDAPRVSIEKIEVEHNVYDSDNVKGMNIKVVFTADHLKDVVLPVNVYFSWPDGTHIISMDGTYQAPDNQVAVRKDAQPGFDSAVYDDFVIFMPYKELEMDFRADTFDIQFQVIIFDDKNNILARSEYVPFTYTSPGP